MARESDGNTWDSHQSWGSGHWEGACTTQEWGASNPWQRSASPQQASQHEASHGQPNPNGAGQMGMGARNEEEFCAWLKGLLASSTWLKVLSQHSTQKPALFGGPPNPAGVLPSISYRVVQWTGLHEATISLPNSFLPDDGIVIQQVGRGRTKGEAEQDAAFHVLAGLLQKDPHHVRLMDQNWHCSAEDVRCQAAARLTFHPPRRAQGPMSGLPMSAQRPATGGQQQPHTRDAPWGPDPAIEAEKQALITRIIQHHHELNIPQDPDPSKLHNAKAFIPDLDRLFHRGMLRQWLQTSVLFRVNQVDGSKQWSFTFASATDQIGAIIDNMDSEVPHGGSGAASSPIDANLTMTPSPELPPQPELLPQPKSPPTYIHIGQPPDPAYPQNLTMPRPGFRGQGQASPPTPLTQEQPRQKQWPKQAQPKPKCRPDPPPIHLENDLRLENHPKPDLYDQDLPKQPTPRKHSICQELGATPGAETSTSTREQMTNVPHFFKHCQSDSVDVIDSVHMCGGMENLPMGMSDSGEDVDKMAGTKGQQAWHKNGKMSESVPSIPNLEGSPQKPGTASTAKQWFFAGTPKQCTTDHPSGKACTAVVAGHSPKAEFKHQPKAKPPTLPPTPQAAPKPWMAIGPPRPVPQESDMAAVGENGLVLL